MRQAPDLSALLSKVALKDHNAFKTLYDLTSPKLFAVCLRILKDEDSAADVLQEVYVSIWQKAAQFETGRATPMAWLATIARNRAIDLVRTRRPVDDIDDHGEITDANPDPETQTISSNEKDRLENCLGQLDERHAAIIRNTYLSGWTYQQAADAETIPLNTAKTWVRRGLQALKDCLSR